MGGRVLRVEVLVCRNVTDDVNVNALWPDAVLKEQLIVFQQVAQREARVEIRLRAAVPVPHEWNVAPLGIAKA